MKKIFFLAVLLLGAVGCTKSPSPAPEVSVPNIFYDKKITVGENTLLVYVADTDEARQQGLSGKEKLSDQQGMLFDFTNSKQTKPGFWMKDMKFGLDFIWIKNNKIIGITPDVPAPIENSKLKIENLPLYYPPSDIDRVLEVNAGWSAEHKIKIGDEVLFNYLQN